MQSIHGVHHVETWIAFIDILEDRAVFDQEQKS